MNINEAYNELICKYDIDRPFPGFRTYLECTGILKELLNDISDNTIVVYAKDYDFEYFSDYVFSGRKVEAVKVNPEEGFTIGEELKGRETLIISYYCKEVVKEYLISKKIKTLCVYDYFESKGISCLGNFYDIYRQEYDYYRTGKLTNNFNEADLNKIFFYHRRLFELEENASVKQRALEKCIFDLAYVKDFNLLSKYIEDYSSLLGDTRASLYKQFLEEVDVLLRQIRERLKGIKDKSTIMFWLDALEYGEDEDMPFLLGINDKAVVFEKMYCVTPYTTPAFKTLFLKKRCIEEDSFTIDNIIGEEGGLLKELIDKDYDFKYYGILNILDEKFLPGHLYKTLAPFSICIWDALIDIVDNIISADKKCFYVLHCNSTHAPFASFGIDGDSYSHNNEWPGRQTANVDKLRKQQFVDSKKYIDKLLGFWDDYFPEHMIRIYMSDHGHTEFGRYHTIMKIRHKDLKPQKCGALCSFFDFDNIVLSVINSIEKKPIGWESFDNDYVLIQDVDYYYKNFIIDAVKELQLYPDSLIGYQGVITKEDLLIVHNHGLKKYAKLENTPGWVSDNRIDYLKEKISTKIIDAYREDKFKYSRLYLTAEKKYRERSKKLTRKINDGIIEFFEKLDGSIITAIRGGGVHTYRLMMLLPERLRNKISFVIDNDSCCYAHFLGANVIGTDNIRKNNIKRIIISSFRMREAFKKELESFDSVIEILDLYDELKIMGIDLNNEFWHRDFIEDDIDWSVIQ